MQRVEPTAQMGISPAAPGKPRAAVLVIHGIGEQVQFETIARAAEGLAGLDAEKDAALGVRVRAVATPEGELRRAEVDVRGTEVHVYEAYWAPLTKGRVTLREVVAFLVRGATSGIVNAWSGTRRFVFGKIEEPRRNPLTLLALVVATLVLASVVVIDAFALAVAAARLGVPTGLSQRAIDEGSLFILIFALSALALVVWMAAARSARAVARGSALSRGVIVVTWLMFALTLAAMVALAGVLGIYLATGGDAPWAPASAPPTAFVVGSWAALIAATYAGRSLLVDYVGDVAAYVSPQKLDRFHELRKEIKDAARRAANAVYAQDYESVAIVGHSLGSVVAYDTLNGLLREDALKPEASRRVKERTRLLLTFGSPLDKTAFIFATAKSGLSPTREALATLSQPLLLDEDVRARIPWLNVYSRADPVSGRLDLYGKVENVKDPHASTPLLAHNEYWTNELVWRRLRDRLVPEPARTVPVEEPAAAAKPVPRR